jgi:hypothetical protein
MPVVGRPGSTEFNIVPRDFVVDAITYLSGLAGSRGATYALADPHPLTVDEVLKTMGECTEQTIVRVPLPLGMAKWSIERMPGVFELLRIPASSVDYFVHPTRYDTRVATAALQGSGVVCPRFPAYAPALVRFMRSHPDISSAAMA